MNNHRYIYRCPNCNREFSMSESWVKIVENIMKFSTASGYRCMNCYCQDNDFYNHIEIDDGVVDNET